MSWFKIPFTVCIQNMRKWTNDYRAWAIGTLILVINIQAITGFIPLSQEIGKGISPWIFPFFTNSWWGMRVITFLPLLVLFCDAPFIDANQPYIITRSGRYRWSIGQVLYIITASAAYFIILILFSMVLLIGNMDLTLDWGAVLSTASRFPERINEAGIGVSSKILYYFTPFTAMLYSFLLLWFSAIFIGLVIYVVNALTGKSGYGITAGGLFIFWDVVVSWLSFGIRSEWMNYFSPVSWSNLNMINIDGTVNTPNITFILCAYAVLIIGLSAAAVFISKKQEINVIQSV